MLVLIAFIGGVICVVSRAFGCGTSFLLHSCHCPIRDGIFSPAIRVEALRVGFDEVPLPLDVCSAPKEVIAEASKACGITVNLCVASASVAHFCPEAAQG